MWTEILSCVFAWAVAVWLLPRLNWRSWQARYSLATYLGVVIVATLRLPSLAHWLDQNTGLIDLSRLLQYLAMLGLAFAWAQICFGIAVYEVQPRRWIMMATPIIGAVIVVLWFLGTTYPNQSLPNSQRSDFSLAITMLAQWQVFATTIGIGFPTTIYCYGIEINPAIRLRYAVTLMMQLAAGMMTGAVIGIHAVLLLGWLPRDYQSSAINLLMLITGLLYLVSILPLKWYTLPARLIQHTREMQRVYKIRRVETHIAKVLGQTARRMSWRDVFLMPNYALYTSVIAILDTRKRLLNSNCPNARRLAAYLDDIAQRTQNYTEVVRYLQRSAL